MKKKIGTITFHSSYNHGSVLQAYALQEYILNRYGDHFDYTIINLRTKRQKDYYNKPFGYYDIKSIAKAFLLRKYKRLLLDGRKNYEDFIKNRLNITEEYSTEQELRNAEFDFDYYISGSDQIWNYPILDFDWSYFLEFCKKGKKISYAASLGPNKIDNCDDITRARIEKDLTQYSFISVREKGSYDTVKKITGKSDVSINIDPTLLLTKEDWEKIIERKRLIKEDYIFLYDLKNKKESFEIASYISKLYNLPIVVVKNEFLLDRGYDNIVRKYDAGPAEFLNYIKNAKIVISSSFHGNVFSILLNKPFLAVGGKKDNRIRDLLTIAGLEDRAVDNVDDIMNKEALFNIDYQKCKKGLNRERKKSDDYLRKALDMGNAK